MTRSLLLISLILIHPPTTNGDELTWHDVQKLGIEGQGWKQTKAPFDRLPGRAEGVVRPPVWNLSRHAAGLCVRFVTDSPSIHARWTLTSERLAMPHMPATGVSGLDLYVKQDGRWRWLGVGRPTDQTNTAVLTSDNRSGEREYCLYLPLYNGVSNVEIGIPQDSTLKAAPPRPEARRKPIVFYGTSITQGGCASRPGMVHPAILGRWLDTPVINLGFSGNGTLDLEIARLLTEIDAAVYVIDCLPNVTSQAIEQRGEAFVRILLKSRPKTPILLVEDRTYANAFANESKQARHRTSRAALRKIHDRLIADKAGGVHYLEGEALLGDDGEDTVDGSHPTDLGFWRQAQAFRPVLEKLLPEIEVKRPLVEGYTDRVSYAPGETIRFHVSCRPETFSLTIAREGTQRERILRKENLPGEEHPIPEDASSHGCRWPAAWTFTIPDTWKSGYYVGELTCTDTEGQSYRSELWFIVRPREPGRDTKILLPITTNTYNAYANWGGYSLYAFNGRFGVQGRRVSFDRPVRSQFDRWERHFVRWAEGAGYQIDYCENNDLEARPDLLKQYRLVLSVGHDEYWSGPMRDTLEGFIKDGGNVAFFSGNTCCWQVRTEDKGRALVCWKQAFRDDPDFDEATPPPTLSTLWGHHLLKRPENELTGVGFLWGGYHRSHGQFMDGPAAFTVHRPEHWLFEGTGIKSGEQFGGKDTIVGYECDGCELIWKNGLPEPTFRDGTPRSFRVLATCPARWHPDDCEWYERWEKGRTGNAVLGTYTQGGTVITVGTTDWAHGLTGNDPVVVRVTRNVLDRLSK